jgi:hypothetical protein
VFTSVIIAFLSAGPQTGRADLPPMSQLVQEAGVIYTGNGPINGVSCLFDSASKIASAEALFDLLFRENEVPGFRLHSFSPNGAHTIAELTSSCGRTIRKFASQSGSGTIEFETTIFPLAVDTRLVSGIDKDLQVEDSVMRRIGDQRFVKRSDSLTVRFAVGPMLGVVRGREVSKDFIEALAVALELRASMALPSLSERTMTVRVHKRGSEESGQTGILFKNHVLVTLDCLVALGASIELVCDRVNWHATVSLGEKSVKIDAYSWNCNIEGTSKSLSFPPISYGGELLVPIDEIGPHLGLAVFRVGDRVDVIFPSES